MKTKKIDKQLATYSTAAGAVLLGAVGADATVQSTVTNIVMDVSNGEHYIDFNKDSAVDIRLIWRGLSGSINYREGLVEMQNNAEVAQAGTFSLANISFGAAISSGLDWGGNGPLFTTFGGTGSKSAFNSVSPGYIGFRFDPSGSANNWLYGWIHIENVAADMSSYEITGYGYEDLLDTATPAGGAVPEPSSLALLAFGAVGVRALRRFNRPGA